MYKTSYKFTQTLYILYLKHISLPYDIQVQIGNSNNVSSPCCSTLQLDKIHAHHLHITYHI